jgi:archaemetzincin
MKRLGKLLLFIFLFQILISLPNCLNSHFWKKDRFMEKIVLVGIGDIERETLVYLKENLEDLFKVKVDIGKSLPLSNIHYNSQRKQFYSTSILKELQSKFEIKEGEKILGILDVDLYVPQLNFVFGEATLSGNSCLISLTRLRESFYGLKENRSVFLDRAVKEAVHEIGHTLGLPHCANKRCVMHFSNSLLDTDYKGRNFCSICKAKLD